jgi:hypothetical protein
VPEETERMQALVSSSPAGDGLAAICRVLLNTNEFVYVQ